MNAIADQLRSVIRARLTLEQRTRLRALQTGSVDAVRRAAHALVQNRDAHHWVPDIYGRSAAKQLDIREQEPFGALAARAVATRRTLLYYDRLHVIYQALSNVAARLGPEETLTTMEVGVYKGGGSWFIASVADALTRGRARHFAVDTFEGHSADDVPGTEGWHTAGSTFRDTDYSAVKSFLGEWPFVEVLKGRVQEHEDRLSAERFHFIHLDVDIHAPTRYVLERYGERLAPGGIIVVDDYAFRSCPGVKQAVAEVIAQAADRFTTLEMQTGQCLLARIR